MPDPPVRPATGYRALIVDDEPGLVRAVSGYLQREGFTVAAAGDGEQALALARAAHPDVVVLDLMLPGIDGIEVCRRLRTFSDAYVIMLTARADEIDKLIGLSVGADDYLTKPFSMRELVARIRTMLRRPRLAGTATSRGRGEQPASAQAGAGPSTDAQPQVLRFGALTIDLPAREVRLDGRQVELTRTEFDVVATLGSRPRQVHSRRQLIESVWGGAWVGDEHLVDIHVGHVRRKLADDPARPRYILTVRGIGYRMGPG